MQQGKLNLKELYGRGKNVHQIPIDKLQEEPGFNFREPGPDFDQYIRELADYIKENGVPGGPLIIRTKGDNIFLRDGHCRVAAARLAISEGCELQTIGCMVMDRTANDADEIALLVTANSHRAIAPLELAKIVKRLHVLELKPAEIGRVIGKYLCHAGSGQSPGPRGRRISDGCRAGSPARS
jgi:ParB-like chromosome segregation protein Spo0J